MDYRKESESRLMEASIGAHKLTQMINSWQKVPILDEQPKDFEGSFDLERSLITLKNLQEATRMMALVRQNLELDLEHEELGFVSTRSSSNCIEELKKVVRESNYGRNFGLVSTDDEWAPSSRSLRLSSTIEDSVQPKRTKSSNLVAKLMGLESIPSDFIGRKCGEFEHLSSQYPVYSDRREDNTNPNSKCLLRSDTPSSIDMLKARMLRLTKGVTLENEAVEDRKNMLHGKKIYIYEDVPPVVILKTRQSQEKSSKICDRKKIITEQKEVKRCEKPQRKPLQNRKAQQQHQERMSSCTKKRESGPRYAPVRESKDAVKVKKAIPAPISQPKLSYKSLVATNRKLDSRDSIDPSKKKRETKPARKSMDIIIQVTGDEAHNDVRGINRSRHRALPYDKLPNSKQCNRGHRRKDPKLFCESDPKHFRCDKPVVRRTGKAKEDIKQLLWSSRSFIDYARQLCGQHDDYYQTTYHRTKCVSEDTKLILGCAKELVVRKSHHLERSRYATTSMRLSSSTSIVTVDQLVEEIANEVAELRARREVGEGVSSRDAVRATVEGDMKCRNMLVNAMWDEGWQEWMCVEEAYSVVGTVEKLILCCLVEELVLDFKGIIA